MGYTTDFQGHLDITPAMPRPLVEYLNLLAGTRRMKRNLPAHFGVDGEFFADGKGFGGQDRDDTVVEYNTPPSTQPSLWLQWNISEDGTKLEWDDGEKFYSYVEWLEYLYKEIILPLGFTLGGTIKWRGEDFDDMGKIIVDGSYITADGYKAMDCTPDASPRFIECIKVVQPSLLPGEQRKVNTVDRLLDQLDDIADRVESRSKAQAYSIRECSKRLREALKG